MLAGRVRPEISFLICHLTLQLVTCCFIQSVLYTVSAAILKDLEARTDEMEDIWIHVRMLVCAELEA